MTGWWYDELKEFSPLAIILIEWAPVLLSILVGGLFATILFPRWQDRYISRKATADRRNALVEEASELLSSYTISWRRLIEMSAYAQKQESAGEDASFAKQKTMEYANQRSDLHKRLLACLSRTKIYVTAQQRRLISEFIQWSEGLSTMNLEQLPEIEEWREWEEKLLAELGS